jgi:HAD superfamily hydrolase (TIGR01450 family)
VRLEDARGFVFDLDGTLVQRAKSHYEVIPGAPEAIAALRAAGRPFVIFTNASHTWPADIARELRADGLDVHDDEVLTPICSALTYLNRRHSGRRVYAFGTPAVRERLAQGGVDVLPDERAGEAEVVFVATPVQFDLQVLDDAARAITEGAALVTSSYVPAYSGANGRIFSKGSMVTAALQKATGRRPRIVGKPSRAAVEEIEAHLGVPAREIAVVGDDVALEVALGHIGGSHTVLVRSGISGGVDFAKLSKTRRPHEVIEGVGELVARL